MLLLRRFLLAVGILSFIICLAPLANGVASYRVQVTGTPTNPPTPPPIETPTP